VTLRTPAGLACIRAIAGDVEAANVGAGTVLDARQYAAAEKAGAKFMVSPGATDSLHSAAANSPIPFLPGAATASETMALADRGYRFLKFFPAEPAGGVAYLKALAAPLPAIRFCPTGGIGAKNAADYLGLGNVICVGGSWVAPAEAVAGGDWGRITDLSRTAAALRATG
jgi:2-dehydro-3-deoxyphosphogluconate aldolase/(4S)-4-hydroxy-2-oxoglutarate aldolase